MQAVILAAGMGSRLGTLTEKIPKALIDVGGKPLIAHSIEILRESGVRRFVIVTGYRAYKIRSYLEEHYDDIDVEYVHNHRYETTNNIYSLYLAAKQITGPYYILNSDIIFHPGIFRNIHESEKENLTISVDFRENLGEEEMKVVVEDERVVEISKKIDPARAHGEYIGITKVTERSASTLVESLEETMDVHGKRVFYEHAFQMMIDKGHEVNYAPTSGLAWTEIDTIEDLIHAREEVYPAIAGR
ncbi:phosphocholine cytidylyltransferase family protein [Geoglobus ahangari]